MHTRVQVAVVQAAPVFFDKNACIDKAASLTAQAAAKGAKIVLFPESFIPCYPWSMNLGPKIGQTLLGNREDYQRFFENTLSLTDPETDRLAAVAAKEQVFLAMGLTERDGNDLYCSMFFWGPNGTFRGRHRKLKPTGQEGRIWSQGDGSELTALETPYGTMGSVICWENYMPLLRAAMYAKGVSLYLAPTADSRDHWQNAVQHIALEGRCFVLSCNQYVTKSMLPEGLAAAAGITDLPETLNRGGSAIVSPTGEYLAGPLFDEEGILVADLDLKLALEARYDFDPIASGAGVPMEKLFPSS